LRWKAREETHYRIKIWNKRFAGKVVGNANSEGILQVGITLEGEKYFTTIHRLIWAFESGEWPPAGHHIDHRAGDRSDNRIHRLRPGTTTENARNKKLYRNNTSGFKGVSWDRQAGRWFAQIGIEKKVKKLGFFDDPMQAARAYDAAAISNFGRFARTNASMGLLP